MKKLLLALAVVGATLFTACNKDQDCGHEFIEYDNTKNLVGTWTYWEDGLAEAMVIKEDGSFEVTGLMKGGYMYESKGTIKVVNNKVSLVFEGDDEVTEGRLELVAGKSMSIVINEEYGVSLNYDYCKEDLSDEIVGMWVCNEGPKEMGMTIQTYTKDGKAYFTGAAQIGDENIVNVETSYKVIGDLLIQQIGGEADNDYQQYYASRLTYAADGTSMGDIMTHRAYLVEENSEVVENTSSWLRVKENLNLAGKTYDYISAYVTNVKGKDEEFSIMGNIFNIANINAGDFDIILGSTLFCVELNANSIKHQYILNGQDKVFDAPITVDGNKVTLDMSAVNPALRKVEMYMFQDADDSQLHMYMHTDAFINYFANLEVVTLLQAGKINQSDAAAVAKVFADMEARVESINVSFVFKARK